MHTSNLYIDINIPEEVLNWAVRNDYVHYDTFLVYISYTLGSVNLVCQLTGNKHLAAYNSFIWNINI